jgi:hypothetical protein
VLAQYVAGAVACLSYIEMSNLFPCVELQRSKQQYQTALRIWGHFESTRHNEPEGSRARQAEQLALKQEALNARNEASGLPAHREKCRICRAFNLRQDRSYRY